MLFRLFACADPTVALETAETGVVPEDDTLPVVVSDEPCDACGGDCRLEHLSYAASYHTSTPIDYASVPPAGGPHHPCWAPFGVHPEPVEDDRFVHDLEHGAVVFLHDCPGCPEVAELESVVEGSPFGLSTPYPGLPTPFAAVSWGWRLSLGCWDQDAALVFRGIHQDQAPESVLSDPAADCMP